MNKIKVLIIILFLAVIYGILLCNSYVLNFLWPQYVERIEDDGIEFVAMTRIDTSYTFPDIEVSHEYRLFAKRKWYYPYDKLLDDDFFFDQDSIPASGFVPYAKVFNFDGMKYIAVIEKIIDKDFYEKYNRVQLKKRLSKIVIFDPLQWESKGMYQEWNIEGYHCDVDSILSVKKNEMINVKTVLRTLGQDTLCIRDIIDCFPNYVCSTIRTRNSHVYSSK